MRGDILPPPMRLHDVMLSSAQGQLYLYLYLISLDPPNGVLQREDEKQLA